MNYFDLHPILTVFLSALFVAGISKGIQFLLTNTKGNRFNRYVLNKGIPWFLGVFTFFYFSPLNPFGNQIEGKYELILNSIHSNYYNNESIEIHNHKIYSSTGNLLSTVGEFETHIGLISSEIEFKTLHSFEKGRILKSPAGCYIKLKIGEPDLNEFLLFKKSN